MDNKKHPYNRLNKEKLVEKVLENEIKSQKYDILENKYDILKMARKEDIEVLKKAHELTGILAQKEEQIVASFRVQLGEYEKTITEQSQTVLTLFEMMDNSINQQVFYYNKFKEIFVNSNKPVDVKE